MAKLITVGGFTKWVSIDVPYLYLNDIFEFNPPYMQSGCWQCQSYMSELNLGINFYVQSGSNV